MNESMIRVAFLNQNGKKVTLLMPEAIARDLMHQLWIELRHTPPPPETPK